MHLYFGLVSSWVNEKAQRIEQCAASAAILVDT